VTQIAISTERVKRMLGKVHLQQHHPLRQRCLLPDPRRRAERQRTRRAAAGPMSTNGPWRWTPSCPGTTAAQATSATCRPSASAAMPAGATAVCRRKRPHRLPLPAGQLRPALGGGHSLVVPQSHGVDGLVLHQPEWN
jgi:hypothetical protein